MEKGHEVVMANRSDWGSSKPRRAGRVEPDDVRKGPIRGLHQGQQSYVAT